MDFLKKISRNDLEESDDDFGGGEVIDEEEEDIVYDLHDRGEFDQNDANDLSRHEVRSSWSSSEEALDNCEGLIFNVPLEGSPRCSQRVAAEGRDPTRDPLNNVTARCEKILFLLFLWFLLSLLLSLLLLLLLFILLPLLLLLWL